MLTQVAVNFFKKKILIIKFVIFITILDRASTSSTSSSPLPISHFLASSTFDFSVDNSTFIQRKQSTSTTSSVNLVNNMPINIDLSKNVNNFFYYNFHI